MCHGVGGIDWTSLGPRRITKENIGWPGQFMPDVDIPLLLAVAGAARGG